MASFAEYLASKGIKTEGTARISSLEERIVARREAERQGALQQLEVSKLFQEPGRYAPPPQALTEPIFAERLRRYSENITPTPQNQRQELIQRAVKGPEELTDLERLSFQRTGSQLIGSRPTIEEVPFRGTPLQRPEVPGYREVETRGFAGLFNEKFMANNQGAEILQDYNNAPLIDRLNPASKISIDFNRAMKNGDIQSIETLFGIDLEENEWARNLKAFNEGFQIGGTPKELISEFGELQREQFETDPHYRTVKALGDITKRVFTHISIGRGISNTPLPSYLGTKLPFLDKLKVPETLANTKYGATLSAWLGQGGLSEAVGRQTAELLVDTLAQEPFEITEAIREDQSLDEFSKRFFLDRGIDIFLNGMIDVPIIRREWSSLAEYGYRNIQDTINSALAKQLPIVSDRANLYVGNLERIAKTDISHRFDAPVDRLTRKVFDADVEIKKVIDDFNAWAGGKQILPENLDAMKQTYREATGVDIDTTLKELSGFRREVAAPLKAIGQDVPLRPTLQSYTPEQKALRQSLDAINEDPIISLNRQLARADSVTSDAVKQFNDWRADKFDGKFGRIDPEDLDTLRAWYAEDTGIDIKEVIETQKNIQYGIEDALRLADIAGIKPTVDSAIDNVLSKNTDTLFAQMSRADVPDSIMQDALDTIDILAYEAKDLLNMNLQLFAKNNDFVSPQLLKKHIALLEDMSKKGATKSSVNEVEKLIQAKKDIKNIKDGYKSEIKELKETVRVKKTRRQAIESVMTEGKKASKAIKNMPEPFRSQMQPILDAWDFKAGKMRTSTEDYLLNLQQFVKDMKDKNIGFVADTKLMKKLERLGKKALADFSNEELESVRKSMAYIRKQASEYTKYQKYVDVAHAEIMSREVGEFGDEMLEGYSDPKLYGQSVLKMKPKGAVDFVNFYQLDPDRMIARMTGFNRDSLFYKTMHNEATEGARKGVQLEMDVLDEFKRNARGVDMNGIRNHKYEASIMTTKGLAGTIHLDGMTKLYIIRGWDDVGFRRHILAPMQGFSGGGGIGSKGGTKFIFNQADIDAMKATLTPDEIKYLDAFDKMVAEGSILTKAVSDVYYDDFGYNLELVDGYTPIIVDRAGIPKPILTEGVFNLARSPFVQPRVDSTIPTVWEGLDSVAEKLIMGSKNYVSFRLPTKQMASMLGNPKLSNAIINTWGDRTFRYLVDLTNDLNGARGMFSLDSEAQNAIYKALARTKGAVLGANVKTGLKQIPSWMSAIPEIGPEYIASAFKPVDWATVYKHSPIMAMRDQGFVTADMAEYIASKAHSMTKKFGLFMRKGDKFAMGRIWNMSEAKIKKLFPDLSGDEFYDKVAREAENAIYKTQPNATLMQRTRLGRPVNLAESVTGMFGTQLRKNYNIMYEAIATFGDNPAKSIQSMMAVSLAQMGVALVSYSGYKFSKRDADYGEEVAKTLVGSFPGGRALTSAVLYKDGFGTPLEGTMQDLIDAFVEVGNTDTKRTPVGLIRDIAVPIATLSGVPVANVERQMVDVLKNVAPELEYAYANMLKTQGSTDQLGMLFRTFQEGKLTGNENFVNAIRSNKKPSGEEYATDAFDRVKSSIVSRVNRGTLELTEPEIREILGHFEDKKNRVKDLPQLLTIPGKKKFVAQYGITGEQVDALIEYGRKHKKNSEHNAFIRQMIPQATNPVALRKLIFGR